MPHVSTLCTNSVNSLTIRMESEILIGRAFKKFCSPMTLYLLFAITVKNHYDGPGYNGHTLAVYNCEFFEILRHIKRFRSLKTNIKTFM
jgi:hypothetical protein